MLFVHIHVFFSLDPSSPLLPSSSSTSLPLSFPSPLLPSSPSLLPPPFCLFHLPPLYLQENRLVVAFCIRLKDKFNPHIGRDFLLLAMKYFARAVLNRFVRPFVVLINGLTLTAALTMVFRVQIGLSQTIALPTVCVCVGCGCG